MGSNNIPGSYREWDILCKNSQGQEEILTSEEAHCIYVSLSYHGGNPKGSFYGKLAKEPWFTMDRVTAEIEKRMLETYKDNASFEILYDDYNVEYVDGEKQ